MYQFMIVDSAEVTHIINAIHPINFDYANRVLSEMGIDRSVKKITFVGEVKGFD